jgi:hypothetical protein
MLDGCTPAAACLVAVLDVPVRYAATVVEPGAHRVRGGREVAARRRDIPPQVLAVATRVCTRARTRRTARRSPWQEERPLRTRACGRRTISPQAALIRRPHISSNRRAELAHGRTVGHALAPRPTASPSDASPEEGGSETASRLQTSRHSHHRLCRRFNVRRRGNAA